MGIDQGEENEQDGSKRSDAGGAITTAAGTVRIRHQQIQPGLLKGARNILSGNGRRFQPVGGCTGSPLHGCRQAFTGGFSSRTDDTPNPIAARTESREMLASAAASLGLWTNGARGDGGGCARVICIFKILQIRKLAGQVPHLRPHASSPSLRRSICPLYSIQPVLDNAGSQQDSKDPDPYVHCLQRAE